MRVSHSKVLAVWTVIAVMNVHLPAGGVAVQETAEEGLRGRAVQAGSVREKIEQLLESSPGTTNLSELEIYESTSRTNSSDHIRKDAVRLFYSNQGGIGEDPMFVVAYHLPSLDRFYIESESFRRSSGPPKRYYYGPFEGDPLKVLAGAAHEGPEPSAVSAAGTPLVNSLPPEPDNPLGLDDETIIRLFEAGKTLRGAAIMASHWAESHHLCVPSSLGEAYAHYLNRDELGNDPFETGKMRLKKVEGKIQVYSVGPDGQWNDGQPIASDDPFLKGDLGVEIVVGGNDVKWLAEGALLDYLQGKHTARYLARKGKHYEKSSPSPQSADRKLSFGPVVDGLSAAVELLPSNGIFTFDQPIELRFYVRNEADYDIQVAGPNWRQGDKLILEAEQGGPVKNKHGRPLGMGEGYYTGISPIQRALLKPGQSTMFRSSGLEFLSEQGRAVHPVGCSVQVTPGHYVVRFRMFFFDAWNAQLMDWQGELETGPLPVEVVAGTAAAEGSLTSSQGQKPREGPLAYFSGRVFDRETGKPITNFWVQLGGTSREEPNRFVWWPDFSGATLLSPGSGEMDFGRFWANTLRGYEGGKAWARVLADGYLPQPVTPEPAVCPSRVEGLEVRMKRGREFLGTVRDASGRPLAGVRLSLTGIEGVSEAQQQQWLKDITAVSDDQGHFALRGAGAEGQQVTAFSCDGLAATPVPVPAPGEDLEIRFP